MYISDFPVLRGVSHNIIARDLEDEIFLARSVKDQPANANVFLTRVRLSDSEEDMKRKVSFSCSRFLDRSPRTRLSEPETG